MGKKTGFTIIEVMLFLAVSALLFIGLLTAVGTALKFQQYRDAVYSLNSFFQSEFNRVVSVQNNRYEPGTTLPNTRGLRCDSNGVTKTGAGVVDVYLGASMNCLILGRYIESSADGKALTGTTVYSTVDIDDMIRQDTVTDDLDALRKSQPVISQLGEDSQRYSLPWGTSIVKPKSDTVETVKVLFVRSPLSGMVHVFRSDTVLADKRTVTQIIDDSQSTNSDLVMCVQPDGLVPTRMAVTVSRTTPSTSGIKVAGDTEAKC